MRYLSRIGLSLFFILTTQVLTAQDVGGFWTGLRERWQKRDILNLSGSVRTQARWNAISGVDRRQPPLNYQLGAGLNFDVLGIQVPFSLAFANGNSVYRLPRYAFYGISPSYQWITVHAGDRSLIFSPYSLAGVNFRGAAVELRPGKFYLAGMTGRLRRARLQDAGSIQRLETQYQRLGRGMKLGYEGEKTQVSVAAFYARDKAQSIDEPLDTLLKPEENLCLDLQLAQTLSDRLSFKFDFTRSALTRDHRSPVLPVGNVFQRMGGLYDVRATTQYANAFRGEIGFAPKVGQFRFGFERIDPGYRSLGALFFQNDQENFTVGGTLPLFKNALNVNGTIGLQRNNLDGRQVTTFNRLVGSLALGWRASERTNAQLNYSNFSTTNRLRAISVPFVLVDSIVIVQTNHTASASVSYLLNPTGGSVLTGMISYQQANDIRNDVIDRNQTNRFAMAMVAYAYQPQESVHRLTASLLATTNRTSNVDLWIVGPSLAYQTKVLGERLELGSSLAYSLVRNRTTRQSSPTLRCQLQAGTELGEHQQLNLQCSYVRVGGDVGVAFDEVQLSMGYGYQF